MVKPGSSESSSRINFGKRSSVVIAQHQMRSVADVTYLKYSSSNTCLLPLRCFAANLQDLVSASNDFEVEMIDHEHVLERNPSTTELAASTLKYAKAKEGLLLSCGKVRRFSSIWQPAGHRRHRRLASYGRYFLAMAKLKRSNWRLPRFRC